MPGQQRSPYGQIVGVGDLFPIFRFRFLRFLGRLGGSKETMVMGVAMNVIHCTFEIDGRGPS